MEIAILITSILCLIALVVLIVLNLKKDKGSKDNNELKEVLETLDTMQEAIQRDIYVMRAELKTSIETSSKTYNDAIGPYMNSFNEKLDKMTQNIDLNLSNIKDRLSSTSAELVKTLNSEMEKITQSNEKKLEDIKNVVDEKLQSTLEKRINAAFEQVTTGLAEVQKRFGEMSELSSQVSSLNKNFMNVKTRGNWGEVSLESLLDQILAPEQYEKQYMLSKNSLDRVDFVVKLPGKTDKDTVFLPIDSKFPIEDYNRLVDASEKGKTDEVQIELDNLKRSVKTMAKSIKDKYIKVPTTTDFAVMYLPTEGLYSEIVKDPILTNE